MFTYNLFESEKLSDQTLNAIRDKTDIYNFQICNILHWQQDYRYKTHFLFFQLVLSPKMPVLQSSVTLFFIPLVKLGVTVPLLLCTPFFQLCLFHIHSTQCGKRAHTRTHTHDTLSIYQPSHSVSDPSTTHVPFSVLIFTPSYPFVV